MITSYVTDYVSPPDLGVRAQWVQKTRGVLYAFALGIFRSFQAIFGFGRLYENNLRLKKKASFPTFSPPNIQSLAHKTNTYTFNHIAEFAIADKRVWTRREGTPWRQVHYEGAEPVFIDSDGANLLVIDVANKRHYKKAFSEYRRGKIPPQKLHHFKDVDLTQYDYYAIDKTQWPNWRKHWFSLPYISTLVHSVCTLDETVDLNKFRAVAISHRGVFNDYYTSFSGRKHFNLVGTTTFFTLSCRSIGLPDPWAPPWSKINVPLPENENYYCEGVDMKASGSGIFLAVFKHNKATGESHLEFLTRNPFDIDVDGYNDFLTYSYNKKDDHARVLSPEIEWVSHPLPTTSEEIRGIDFRQTGKGNSAREMRVITLKGYFRKMIDEKEWMFVEDSNVVPKPPYKSATTDATSKGAPYMGTWRDYKITIPFYGAGVEACKVYLSKDGVTHELFLRKRCSIMNFLGLDWPHVDIIIPEESRDNEELIRLFRGRISASL